MAKRAPTLGSIMVGLVLLGASQGVDQAAGQGLLPENRLFLPLIHRERSCLLSEQEPNNSRDDALLLPPVCKGDSIRGFGDAFMGQDVFRIHLDQYAGQLRVDATFATSSEAEDLDVALHDAAGVRLALAVQDQGRRRIAFADVNDGDYFINVFTNRHGSLGGTPYTLTWQAAGPPKLITPWDEALVVAHDLRITLDWEPVLADNYRVDIHHMNDADDRIGWKKFYSATAPPFTLPALPMPGEYWWTVTPIIEGREESSSGQLMFNLCREGIVLGLSSRVRKSAEVNCVIQVKDRLLTDREYRITTLPPILADLQWIRTSQDGAEDRSTEHLRFRIQRPSTVYLAVDPRQDRLPAWMEGFNDTGMRIGISDEDVGQLNVYSRQYPTGSVVLGGMSAPPAAGVEGNYIVIVHPDGTAPIQHQSAHSQD